MSKIWYAIITLRFLDIYTTFLNIEKHGGYEIEGNPIVRHALNLGGFPLVIAYNILFLGVFAFFLGLKDKYVNLGIILFLILNFLIVISNTLILVLV